MGEMLAFVVAGATCEERAAVDARLKRRRFPQLERFGGLDVVMAVNHKMLPATRRGGLDAGRLRDDDRITLRRAQTCAQTDRLAVLDEPARSGFDVATMIALCGDARETEIVTQFAGEAGFVFLDVGQDILHGCRD